MINTYDVMLKEILKYVEELPRYGSECNCEWPDDVFDYIHYGNWVEAHRVCLICGGFLDIE